MVHGGLDSNILCAYVDVVHGGHCVRHQDSNMKTAMMRIRLPVSAKAWLLAQAKTNHRTMNAEVLILFEAAMAANRTKKEKAHEK